MAAGAAIVAGAASLVVATSPEGRPVALVEVRGPDGRLLEAAVIDPIQAELEAIDRTLADDLGGELELTLDPDLEQEG